MGQQGPVYDLGPCSITFDSVSLGETKGDVMFRYTEETRPVYEDSKGVSPIDEIHVGMTCEVEVPMTRITLAQLATVIPSATVVGTKLTVKSAVGNQMINSAAALILKPLVGGVASANTKWLTVLQAAPKVDLELVFNNDGQRVYKVVFKGFVDANNEIFTIGA